VRYVDAEAAAAFPFGAGLGYTTWTLGPGTASTEPTTSVSAPLTNTGVRRGTQVVQLYARVHVAGLLPRRAILAGFTHVTLDPGETAEVRVAVEPDAYFGISPGATGTLELWPSITGAGDPAEPVVVHIGAT
jgi:beta-glucosidase